MSFTAIVQNDTIKLPVHVPDGTRVEVVVREGPPAADFERWLASSIGLATSGLTTAEIMRLTRGED